MSVALLVVVVVALIGLLFAERAAFRAAATDRPKAAFVLKPIASLGFLSLALLREWPSTPARGLIVLALGLSVVGDVCLLWRTKKWFLAGIAAFLLAHVGYAAAFALRGLHFPILVVGLLLLALPAALVVRALWPHLSSSMRVMVPAYVAVISAMLALAIATRQSWFVGPAILFYLSDLFVARERFLSSGFINRLIGLPLYYAAQLLFAWG